MHLSEVVIESNPLKLEQSQLSVPVEVVSRAYLTQHSNGTLVNTLERLPGLSSINTGIGIAKPVIRGLSFNRVVVTDLGIKQEGQQWGADHGLEIDQFGVERVEILKGPASLLYGSDALGGAINIRPPQLPEEGTFELSALTNFRSYNQNWGNSISIGGKKHGISFRGRFSTQDFGDYQVPASQFSYNRYILPILNKKLKNTAGNERNFSAMIGLNRNWGFSHFTLSGFQQVVGLF
ncbi:MAG: TonB-dependent receptor plug domain-containing protein, partial [Bacteroidia bacterium]|nr:TonB-dependent receptor plug domain-containing protein [Bacteroidia bacterium]